MAKSSKLKNFGVKSFYRTKVKGRKITKIEERIVFFKAKDFDSAIQKANKEARKYLDTYENPFGQEVKTEVLKYFEAFWMFDDIIKSGTELFSHSFIVEKNVTGKMAIKKLVDFDERVNDKLNYKLNYYFRYQKFNGPKTENEIFGIRKYKSR